MLLGNEAIDASLSGRETQIIDLIAAGLSAKEIAKQIEIAPRTVERHIENARLKMRARNRPHLVTRAIASGLIGAAANLDEPALFDLIKLETHHCVSEVA